ncbi:hypothetical protein [Bdellovibrio sp.]|uniref:hypothetical protein n=1 Tax=Bdellovibrio TaxID=958 RepID=UPI003221A694
MKPLIQKTLSFLLVGSSLAVAAGLITKEEVNKRVSAIVAPYNNQTTAMDIQFTDLLVDDVRALDFGVKATIKKKGPENELALTIENAKYQYGNGTAPMATADLTMQTDLRKAFGQETLDQFGEELDKVAQELAADYIKKYGEAAILDIGMEDVQKDEQGHLKSVSMRMNATIDMSKLPADMKAEDVEVRSVQAVLSISTGGARGQIQVVINPAYKGFDPEQTGMKELIEKLLSDDQETYDGLAKLVESLDGFANWFVNQKAEEGQ